MKALLLCTLLFCTLWIVHTQHRIGETQILHQFKTIEFDFPEDSQLRQVYDSKNHAIAGVQVDSEGTIYVSLPRWKPNVVATLATVTRDGYNSYLSAYPSWEMNDLNNKDGLKSVLGFEIDSKNRMWILDQGKVDGKEAKDGDIKLVIWDLKKNKLIHRYNFPKEIASPTNSFLNDIVVDDKRDIAYISDSGVPLNPSDPMKPGLIVYRLSSNTATRFLDSHESVMPDKNLWLQVNGKRCLQNSPLKTGVDGIALSCDFKRLYWSPLTSKKLYGISTSILLSDDVSDKDVEREVINFGDKGVASDGMTCSSKDLIITGVTANQIYTIDEKSLLKHFNNKNVPANKIKKLMKQVLKHSKDMRNVWPDSITVQDGWLYYTSNNLCEFLSGTMDFTQDNFYIQRVFIGADNYQSGCFFDPEEVEEEIHEEIKQQQQQQTPITESTEQQQQQQYRRRRPSGILTLLQFVGTVAMLLGITFGLYYFFGRKHMVPLKLSKRQKKKREYYFAKDE